MPSALPLLALAYGVAAVACVVATVAVLRRPVPESGGGARRAFVVWWTAGGALCAAQSLEAALLASGPVDVAFARSFAEARMALVAVALAGLAYHVGFVATGQRRHLTLVVLGAAAYTVVSLGALSYAPDGALSRGRLLDLILRGDLGVSGQALGVLLLAVPVAAVLALFALTRRTPAGPTRLRGSLLAFGIGVGAAGPAVGLLGWIDPGMTETVGASLAALAILWAYGRVALW